jgi:hypothetical protein
MVFGGMLTAAFGCHGMDDAVGIKIVGGKAVVNEATRMALLDSTITQNQLLSLFPENAVAANSNGTNIRILMEQISDEAGWDIALVLGPIIAVYPTDVICPTIKNMFWDLLANLSDLVQTVLEYSNIDALLILISHGIEFEFADFKKGIDSWMLYLADPADFRLCANIVNLVWEHRMQNDPNDPDDQNGLDINEEIPFYLYVASLSDEGCTAHRLHGTLLDQVCEVAIYYDRKESEDYGAGQLDNLIIIAKKLRELGCRTGEELGHWAWNPEWGERPEGDANHAWLDSASPVHPRASLGTAYRNQQRQEGAEIQTMLLAPQHRTRDRARAQ